MIELKAMGRIFKQGTVLKSALVFKPNINKCDHMKLNFLYRKGNNQYT